MVAVMAVLKKGREKIEAEKAKMFEDCRALGTMLNMWDIATYGYDEATRNEHIYDSLKRYFGKVGIDNFSVEEDYGETGRAVNTLIQMWDIYRFTPYEDICKKKLIAKMEQYYDDFNKSQSVIDYLQLEGAINKEDREKREWLNSWLGENIK